ncbi:hypothetical protein OPV22_002884 [Ensete ventricosum]|uniref:Protein kinase domain-containing protein n=1 Tax=Ensete ventricosum TaxID=4639 RepID=A0AAV8RZ94_ENSVE|nr:hypothetical protein OPV22_002884 [Ensete ventricosum]
MFLLSLLRLASNDTGMHTVISQAVTPANTPRAWNLKHLGPVPAPSVSPEHHGHHVLKHHRRLPPAHSPTSITPPDTQGCEISCSDPLTSTPIGSPCGCVYPMQVGIDLGVAPYELFSRIAELEVDVAAGTFLKQSQVRIMGASASIKDPEKTTVIIDLVPLGEKFDKMTALLTYERFWQKKVPINMSLFGDYDVLYVHYPGLPSPPPSVDESSGPSGIGGHQYPLTANISNHKSQKLNGKIIAIIVLSSFILLVVCSGLVCMVLRSKKHGKSSNSVGPTITSSAIRKTGIRSILSSSLASSMSMSFVSNMATCPPSVRTFSVTELEKATDKFSSNKILGKGGFGRVYYGVMEDGIEVAVKLLTREDQSGDREFIAEVEMLSRLHHRNLVKLIGICIEGGIRCLVYEFVRNGSVESHLHGADKMKGPLDWDARMKIALDFGLAREASEGIHHISTQVMGTFGYVAPEYAMTGHLLVKSDVYSYGVVLLELLSGRKPVYMSQSQGPENLVTWARPLLTSREGLEQLIDPSLGGKYDFDNMAKVAAIASMCVHSEASQRPFMGEVVQALKLICNDMDEACDNSVSQREESMGTDGDFKGDYDSESSWWNGATPRITYDGATSFVTMEYSSGPMEEMQRPHSTSTLVGGIESLVRPNRSGPLRTKRKKQPFHRLRGSMSDHGHPYAV